MEHKKNMMKILHIIPTYYPAFRHGGPVESVHAMNRALVTLGEDVTVYTTDINGPERLNVPLGKPVDVHGVRVFYFPATFRPWEYSREMHKALARTAGGFDLIHITSTFRSVSALGAWYAKKNNVPYVISPRGNLMREPLGMKSALKKKVYIALFEKRILRGASAIHFTVDRERLEYMEAGLPLRRAMVIPNAMYRWGEDDPKFHDRQNDSRVFRGALGIGSGEKIILSLGRISWKKGFDTLVPSFAAILKTIPNALLIIAGEDDEGYRPTVDGFIKKHGVGARVKFTGLLTGEKKRQAFAAADCFVLPSYSENFGMAVVEAMYADVPVVITKNVGISQIVKRNNAGIVIEKEEEALSRAFRDVLRGGESVRAMALRGKELVTKEFLPGAVGEQFISAYRGIISQY